MSWAQPPQTLTGCSLGEYVCVSVVSVSPVSTLAEEICKW